MPLRIFVGVLAPLDAKSATSQPPNALGDSPDPILASLLTPAQFEGAALELREAARRLYAAMDEPSPTSSAADVGTVPVPRKGILKKSKPGPAPMWDEARPRPGGDKLVRPWPRPPRQPATRVGPPTVEALVRRPARDVIFKDLSSDLSVRGAARLADRPRDAAAPAEMPRGANPRTGVFSLDVLKTSVAKKNGAAGIGRVRGGARGIGRVSAAAPAGLDAAAAAPRMLSRRH